MRGFFFAGRSARHRVAIWLGKSSLSERWPSRLVATAAGCRRNDLRRWPDGTVVEYIDQRSVKPLSIHRLVQKLV
jgi:hypothetical protein